MRCIEKTLYTNGRIVTMDAAGTVAEAVLVAGNGTPRRAIHTPVLSLSGDETG